MERPFQIVDEITFDIENVKTCDEEKNMEKEPHMKETSSLNTGNESSNKTCSIEPCFEIRSNEPTVMFQQLSKEDREMLLSQLKALGWSTWLQQVRERDIHPAQLLRLFGFKCTEVDLNNVSSKETMWHLLEELATLMPFERVQHRPKLILTLDDVIELFRNRVRIMVVTGAGISVSCGVPDFRSENGLYARIREKYHLLDPQRLFSIQYFRMNPEPFFSFAKELWPGVFQPSRTHYFIKMLEIQGKLLRNYTQNIDALEQVAGIDRLIQCHGSFATASCLRCAHRVSSEQIRDQILEGHIPYCPRCPTNENLNSIEPSTMIEVNLAVTSTVLKPDIVFFGEMLPESFDRALVEDRDQVDLLVVIGSSLKVHPVASIIDYIPPHIPRILINREPVKHVDFDIQLLGNCDTIVNYLNSRLGWQTIDSTEILTEPIYDSSYGYLFEGAILEPHDYSDFSDSELPISTSSYTENQDMESSLSLSFSSEENDNEEEKGSHDSGNTIDFQDLLHFENTLQNDPKLPFTHEPNNDEHSSSFETSTEQEEHPGNLI